MSVYFDTTIVLSCCLSLSAGRERVGLLIQPVIPPCLGLRVASSARVTQVHPIRFASLGRNEDGSDR